MGQDRGRVRVRQMHACCRKEGLQDGPAFANRRFSRRSQ